MDTDFRPKLIEIARAYLRIHDFTAGYLPQMLLPAWASEMWALFWYSVRSVDNILDAEGANLQRIDQLSGPALFQYAFQGKDQKPVQALKLFMAETKDIIPRTVLESLHQSVLLEQKLYSGGSVQSLATYIDLNDKKSGLPLLIYALLADQELQTHPYFMPTVMAVGRCIQWFDDLLDLNIDSKAGRIFITEEELQILKIDAGDIQKRFPEITQLRTKALLQCSVDAYLMTYLFADSIFGKFCRAVLEGHWAMIADKRAAPLPEGVINNDIFYRHYVGTTSTPFDMPQISERLKYQFFHQPTLSSINHFRGISYGEVLELKKQLESTIPYSTEYLAAAMRIEIPEQLRSYLLVLVQQDTRKMISLQDGYGLPEALNLDLVSYVINDVSQYAQQQIAREGLWNASVEWGRRTDRFTRGLSHELLQGLAKSISGTENGSSDKQNLFSEMLNSLDRLDEHRHQLADELLQWLKR